MAIQIEGAKLRTLNLSRDTESGQFKLTGQYELVSTTGVVIAKQSFNSYNEIEVKPTSETQEFLNNLIQGFQGDLNRALGLT